MKTVQAHNAPLVGYAETLKPFSRKQRRKIERGEAEPLKTLFKLIAELDKKMKISNAAIVYRDRKGRMKIALRKDAARRLHKKENENRRSK